VFEQQRYRFKCRFYFFRSFINEKAGQELFFRIANCYNPTQLLSLTWVIKRMKIPAIVREIFEPVKGDQVS
jgi:hypothetical protein